MTRVTHHVCGPCYPFAVHRKEAPMKKYALAIVAVVLASLWAAAPVAAGTAGYPVKGRTITIMVPSTAGGGTDTATRLLAPILEKDLGVPIQIVNKPRASMQVGLSEVAAAKPD